MKRRDAMSFKSRILAAAAAACLVLPALPAMAGGIMVDDPYARSATAASTTGAAFMMIMNHSGQDDRLIDAKSDVAMRVELHTHTENAQGVMQMIHVAEGFELPDGGMIAMQRGGHHVMFMGLKAPMVQGEMIPLTLVFEKAGEMQIEVPVDLERKPEMGGMQMNHGEMKQGQASN
jgi:copper(I)-binding protein